jgi:hypothetical protein
MANNSAADAAKAKQTARIRYLNQLANKSSTSAAIKKVLQDIVDAEINAQMNTARVLANKIGQENAATRAAGMKTSSGKDPNKVGVPQPNNYKWNLPPHTWSLPVRPAELEPLYAISAADTQEFHKTRRGRLWFWSGGEDITAFAADGSTTTLGAKADAATTAKAGVSSEATKLAASLNNYGFQFLWNPTTISSSVMRNMEITPSNADRLKAVAGAFPGQETVSFNIVLDRINDFACIRQSANPEGLSKYYRTGYPSGADDPFSVKIKELLNRGTMADLEYLFKAINGDSTAWSSLLGKKTANIGFLMPTLLGLVLGPDVTQSLSYVGWLTGITMQHEVFTQDMIPLRTTVSINMECFAGSGLVN